MEIRVHSKKAEPLNGIHPALAEIYQRLQSQPQQWLQSLQENPASFNDLEKRVHHAFAQMADQLVAGLLAQTTQADDFAAKAKKSSRHQSTPIALRPVSTAQAAFARRLRAVGQHMVLRARYGPPGARTWP